MDASKYLEEILQPTPPGDLPDEFRRYGLKLDDNDPRIIADHIVETKKGWARLVNHPKWGRTIRTLQEQAPPLEQKLQDPRERDILRDEVRERLFKKLGVDKWIETRRQEGDGELTPVLVRKLVEQFGPHGISESEIRGRIERLGIRIVEAPRQERTDPVPSWKQPPTELRQVRHEDIRRILRSLEESSLWTFLGISALGREIKPEEIKDKRVAKEKEWRVKATDTRRTNAENLLGQLKTYFQDNPRTYRLFQECESESSLRPEVEAAAQDRLVSLPEQEFLKKEARDQGQDDAWMDRLIRQIAQEQGATVERPKPEERPDTRTTAVPSDADSRSTSSSEGASRAPDPTGTKAFRMGKLLSALGTAAFVVQFVVRLASSPPPTPVAGAADRTGTEPVEARPSAGAAAEVAVAPAAQAPQPPATSPEPPAGGEREGNSSAHVEAAAAPHASEEVSVLDRRGAEEADHRGARFSDRGRLDLATAAFEEATRRDTTYAAAWADLSWTQYRTGRLGDVAASATRAIELAQGDARVLATALYAMGRSAEAAGEREDARKAYARILEIDPAHNPARIALNTLKLVEDPPADLVAAAAKVLQGTIMDDEDVASMDEDEIRVLRNAPYARHGKDFRDPGLNAFYYGPDAQAEVRRNMDQVFNPAALTTEDKANIQFFKVVRALGKSTPADDVAPAPTLPGGPVVRTSPAQSNGGRSSGRTSGAPWKDPFSE